MFRISHLKPAGILIKLLANKSITDTGSIFQILVNRLGKKMTKAKLLFAVNLDFFFLTMLFFRCLMKVMRLIA